jgi:hypothetical protein
MPNYISGPLNAAVNIFELLFHQLCSARLQQPFRVRVLAHTRAAKPQLTMDYSRHLCEPLVL